MYSLIKTYSLLILLNIINQSVEQDFDDIESVFSIKGVNSSKTISNTNYLNSNKTLLDFYDTNGSVDSTLFETENTNNAYMKSVPSSFATLVNFGIDGRRRTLFSSNSDDQQCPDRQIWDPFNGHCRQLYCSAHFTLVGFKCVETNSAVNSQTNITKYSVAFLDSGSPFVNIILGFKLVEPVPNISEWISLQNRSFAEEFTKRFADSFDLLSSEMISNVSYGHWKKAPDRIRVTFVLSESNKSDSSNTNNDAILVVMSQTVNQNALSLPLFDNTLKANSIHSSISEFKSFCGRDSDMPIWYWNSQFYLQTEDNITYLYVNETGRKYRPGQYLGNILYVQHIAMSDRLEPNKVNVSSNAVVCETQTLINESCTRILLNHSEYEWINSNRSNESTKLVTKNGIIHDNYELAPNGVFVCFQLQTDYIQDLVEDILSTVLIVISITALTCVVITYSIFSSLRSTINGFNTINLALCIEIMQILFLASPYVMDCRIAAIILHFVLLLTMSWSSVIAYDMYRTFGVSKMKTRHNHLKRRHTQLFKLRLSYWFTANICAAIVVVISIICEKYSSVLNPEYGDLSQSSSCWIGNPTATLVFFGVPLTLNIIINLVLYLMTVCQVRVDLKTSDSLRKITRIPSDSSETSNNSSLTSRTVSSTTSTTSLSRSTSSLRCSQVLIFTRLGVLMGFTWIIALIIAVVPQSYERLLKALSYVFVVCNTSQGLVLFIAFLCNTKTRNLWKNLINR